MRLQTTIKISNEFKGELSQKKRFGETFEETIQRLIGMGIPSTPVGAPSIPQEILLTDDEALEAVREGKTIKVEDGKNYLRT